MRKSNLPIVLAIAPGTRRFGVAVFRGFELVYYAVKQFKHGASANQLRGEVFSFWKEFYEHYRCNTVVFKEINQYQRTSPNLSLVGECLKEAALRSDVVLVGVSLAEIRSLLNGGRGKPTQKRIFQEIAALYPELEQYRERPSQKQKEYYAYIFSAVAAGLVCLKNMTRNN